MDGPSTTGLLQLLEKVSPGRSQLLVLDTPQREVRLSARNLPRVKVITTENVNVVDLLRHERVVLSLAAVRRLEERYGDLAPADAEAAGAAAPADAEAAGAAAPADAEAAETEAPAPARRSALGARPAGTEPSTE
jgi:hypothetical protein